MIYDQEAYENCKVGKCFELNTKSGGNLTGNGQNI